MNVVQALTSATIKRHAQIQRAVSNVSAILDIQGMESIVQVGYDLSATRQRIFHCDLAIE